jgi:hypothetical protein
VLAYGDDRFTVDIRAVAARFLSQGPLLRVIRHHSERSSLPESLG